MALKKGWQKESSRHALAAKGVKTKPRSHQRKPWFIRGYWGKTGRSGWNRGSEFRVFELLCEQTDLFPECEGMEDDSLKKYFKSNYERIMNYEDEISERMEKASKEFTDKQSKSMKELKDDKERVGRRIR